MLSSTLLKTNASFFFTTGTHTQSVIVDVALIKLFTCHINDTISYCKKVHSNINLIAVVAASMFVFVVLSVGVVIYSGF